MIYQLPKPRGIHDSQSSLRFCLRLCDKVLPLDPWNLRFVTDEPKMSRHVTDDVTDDLEKNLGKTDLVTMSRLNNPGVPRLGLNY
jgi:hypothetical protein